ncbi:MFS transporter, SP family, general alpha glucoside:H+ symporter [Cryptococcus neoformans Gb118]|nr:MFS transporter, SP family, general alpha glucoside:H+ symporter [Cryptococcus neoformans var. grubii Gb118]
MTICFHFPAVTGLTTADWGCIILPRYIQFLGALVPKGSHNNACSPLLDLPEVVRQRDVEHRCLTYKRRTWHCEDNLSSYLKQSSHLIFGYSSNHQVDTSFTLSSTYTMPSDPVTTEQVVLDRVKGDIDDYEDVVQSARQGMESEKALSLRESLRRYPRAVAWSVLLSTSLVMEGFDIILINNFYALPQFVQKYGVELEGGWTITAAWQAGLTNGANVGEIIGLCINGWASERFGYKKTMIGALATKTTLTIPLRSKHLTKNCPASLQSPMWSMSQRIQSSRSLRKARLSILNRLNWREG